MARSGIKKSQFIGSQSVPSGSTFDYVYQGQNYKITDTELFNQFGITGLLQQEGDPTGAPILNKSGTVNNIRNIESGSGIQASISVNGGVEVSHNFDVKLSGVPLIPNPTDTSPIVRSLSSGTGINLSVSDDVITIENSSIPTSTKTVTVSSLADLPSPVAGVITLNPGTEYRFLTDINFGANRLEATTDTVLSGNSQWLLELTYSGASAFITVNDGDPNSTFSVNDLAFKCGTALFLDWESTSGSGIDISNITVESNGMMSLNSISGSVVVIDRTSHFGTGDAISLSGLYSAFILSDSRFSSVSGDAINLGASVSGTVSVNGLLNTGSATYASIRGNGSSNIVAGGAGLVTRVVTRGGANDLLGISPSDPVWLFSLNDSIQDTKPDALLSFSGNSTQTVISVVDTPVLVAGTWVESLSSQTTTTASGRITYDGVRGVRLPIDVSLSIEPASGSNINMSAYIAVNGSLVSGTKRSVTASNGDPASMSSVWQINATQNDYIEVFVENNSNTVNIIASSATLRVN